nr:hypothetical protein [Tanacetum cinerariifolium]
AKLIQKLLLNQKCMGYLVYAYYSISPIAKKKPAAAEKAPKPKAEKKVQAKDTADKKKKSVFFSQLLSAMVIKLKEVIPQAQLDAIRAQFFPGVVRIVNQAELQNIMKIIGDNSSKTDHNKRVNDIR